MLEEKIVELLNQLQTELAPEAYRIGVQLTYTTALLNLIYGVIGIVFVFVILAVARLMYSFAVKISGGDLEDFPEDLMLPYAFGTIVLLILLIIAVLSALFNLLNGWNWVGVFNPELAFAHTIYEKVLGR